MVSLFPVPDAPTRCGGGGAPAAVLAKGTGGVSLPMAGATRPEMGQSSFSPLPSDKPT